MPRLTVEQRQEESKMPRLTVEQRVWICIEYIQS